MTIASACPDPAKLADLIRGSLGDDELQELTDHLENCTSCQIALEQSATGEIPIYDLVSGLNETSPPKQSAYWPAITSVENEFSGQRKFSEGQNSPDGQRGLGSPADTPPEGSRSLHDTDQPPGRASERSPYPPDLEFLEASEDPAYIGRLHHFQIARIIGRGGMGIVLEAFDTHLQRSVAIKVLNPQFQENDTARQRFCREGRAAAAISHEHVVPMYQVAKANEGEVAYLVMQLIEGETLEKRLSDSQPLPAHEIARIGMQIAAGLSAAHSRDMVHRDIKPANILIESETDRVKLTDFGLARATDDIKLTKTGMVTGTPLYMSPEQTLGGTADERSDLFSLGAVMYEMASGNSPFQAPSALGVMRRITEETPPAPNTVNAAITRPMSDLIMSLLQKNPDDRPESAAAVAAALASIVSEHGPISPLQVPAVAASEVKKISGHHRVLQRRWVIGGWIAAAFGLLCLIAAGIIGSRTSRSETDRISSEADSPFPSIVLPGNPGTVWSVDFAPGGKQVAAAIEDGSVRLWDIESQEIVKSFNAHRGIVWMVQFHPTRPLVATSGDDGHVKLWESESFELSKQWRAGNAVRQIAFSPDGSRIVGGDRDGNIHVYDIDSGEEVATRNQPGSILGIDYSADGKLIATVTNDKVVRVWGCAVTGRTPNADGSRWPHLQRRLRFPGAVAGQRRLGKEHTGLER